LETKNLPKLTVVTISYNNKEDIEETIRSVICQNYENLEYIIIDGASTDGTVDIIKKYENQITFWISEKDKNLYDAMNKGIKYATGEWIIFMNAGDKFYDCSVINDIFNYNNLNKINNADLIYGNVCKNYGDFKKIEKAKDINNLWKGMVFSHQSLFVRTKLMKEHPFNMNLRIAADFDFIFHMYTLGYKFLYIDRTISEIDTTGLSNIERIKSTLERLKIVKKYKKDIKVNIFYYWLAFDTAIRKIAKKILPKKIVNLIIQKK